MQLLLYSVIILLIIILSYKFINKSNFIIKTDNNSQNNKSIEEIYNYESCIGCLTYNNKLKPGFKYNITDDRCVKNNTSNYIDEKELQNLLNYSSEPNINFESCNNTYNSLYSTSVGKYIMIFRPDKIKMRLSHISIHGRDINQNPLSSNATIFASNIEKDNNENYVYPEIVLNSSDTNINIFQNGSFIDRDGSFIIITLSTEKNISYIKIKHNNVIDADSLNGSYIIILTDDADDLDNDFKKVVFYSLISGIDTTRIIYTYNHLKTPFPSNLYPYMNVNNWWYFDNLTTSCDNCGSMDGNLFKNHSYVNFKENRCYKPLFNDIPRSIINQDISINDLNIMFKSCLNKFDTRFLPALGKYIYITKNHGTTGIVITKLEIYNETRIEYYNNSDLANLSVLANNYLNSNSTFENVLDDDDNTKLITTSIFNTKILINLGTVGNKVITGLKIKTPTINRLDLIGIKFYVISVDSTDSNNISKMKVNCIREILESDIDSINANNDMSTVTCIIGLNSTHNSPIVNHPEIIINNQVLYDITNKYKTTYKKGTNYYQVPYTIYRTTIGRRIYTLTNANVIDTIDKISMSDAVTLFNLKNGNIDMSSVPDTTNSYILSPIIARFLHIVAEVGKTLVNTINSITIYNSNHLIYKQINNPIILYSISDPIYTSKISSNNVNSIGNEFILIDIEQNVPITFIQINVNSVLNFRNASVSLINNFNIEVYTKIIDNPSITNYLITDYNSINLSNNLYPNKFDYPLCLKNKICNNIVPNSYYITPSIDDRCFKSIANPTTCATGCMDQLLTFNKNNASTIFNNNFVSCLSTRNTTLQDNMFFYRPVNIKIKDSSTGKYLGINENSIILSTNPVIITPYLGSDVYKSFNKRMGLFINNNSSMSIRHQGLNIYAHPFSSNNYEFAWYFNSLSNQNYYIINDYNNLTYLSKDNLDIPILSKTPIRWRIEFVE